MTNLPEQLRAAAKAIEDLQKRHNPEWVITPFNLRFWADVIEKEDHSIETLADDLRAVNQFNVHLKDMYRSRAKMLIERGWKNETKKSSNPF